MPVFIASFCGRVKPRAQNCQNCRCTGVLAGRDEGWSGKRTGLDNNFAIPRRRKVDRKHRGQTDQTRAASIREVFAKRCIVATHVREKPPPDPTPSRSNFLSAAAPKSDFGRDRKKLRQCYAPKINKCSFLGAAADPMGSVRSQRSCRVRRHWNRGNRRFRLAPGMSPAMDF